MLYASCQFLQQSSSLQVLATHTNNDKQEVHKLISYNQMMLRPKQNDATKRMANILVNIDIL